MEAEKQTYPAPYTPWPEKARHRRKVPNALGTEQQHRLLQSSYRTLSSLQVARFSEEEAYDYFCRLRFYENGGKPFCPTCGFDTKIYPIRTRQIFKCGGCCKQFSATSGTIFASRKKFYKDILYAIVVFVNGVSGVSALRLSREMGWSYKTVLVLTHKLRESMALSRSPRQLGGEVEFDGAHFTHKIRHDNIRKTRRPEGERARIEQLKQVVVAARERGQFGESRVTVVQGDEAHGKPFLKGVIAPGTSIVSDNGSWDELGFIGPHSVVNHIKGYKLDGVSSNQVESLFARLRRAERGVYYGISGPNLDLYAEEVSWREDHRFHGVGDQWARLIHAASHCPQSRRWSGYWQRWQADGTKRRTRGQRVSWRRGWGVDHKPEKALTFERRTISSEHLDAVPRVPGLQTASSPPAR